MYQIWENQSKTTIVHSLAGVKTYNSTKTPAEYQTASVIGDCVSKLSKALKLFYVESSNRLKVEERKRVFQALTDVLGSYWFDF